MSLNNVSQRNALAVRAIGTNYLNLIPLRSKLYKTLLTLRQRGLELYVITKTHNVYVIFIIRLKKNGRLAFYRS